MRTYIFTILLLAFAYACSAQEYAPQSYWGYLKKKDYSQTVEMKLEKLANEGQPELLLAYTDSIAAATLDFSLHIYRAEAYAKLGDTINAEKEAFLHLDSRPHTPLDYLSKKSGVSLAKLQAYQPLAEKRYLARCYPYQNSAVNAQVAEIKRKDQYRRVINPATQMLDSVQAMYDKENAKELTLLVKGLGHWVKRYLMPDPKGGGYVGLLALLAHFPPQDNYFFIPYLIRDCEEGFCSWQEAELVILKLSEIERRYIGYCKLYGTALNKEGQIDIEGSLLGISSMLYRVKRGKEQRVELQATTNFTNEDYLGDLERVRQHLISKGASPEAITIIPEKKQIDQLPTEPVCYIVFQYFDSYY